MSIEQRYITVSGLKVEIVRKDIKNLHLGVYPPLGRVRVAVPLRVKDDAVRLAVIGKLGWIKRQRACFDTQQRQSRREMVSGESHYFLGRRYRLRVIYREGAPKVILGKRIELHLPPGATSEQRERLLQRWYCRQLRELVPPLLKKWQKKLNVSLVECRIKKMKTKWGTCTADARRIWLNLELAKKPVQCLEYIIVHELVHLIERHHNDQFLALMDEHLPQWRLRRAELNAAPLAHESWNC